MTILSRNLSRLAVAVKMHTLHSGDTIHVNGAMVKVWLDRRRNGTPTGKIRARVERGGDSCSTPLSDG